MCIDPPRPLQQPVDAAEELGHDAGSGSLPRASVWPCERYVEMR